jgi:hypothetical protein
MEQPSGDDRQIQGSLREVFLDRLAQDRDCGSCVACCKSLHIDKPELQKAAGVLCPHNTGSACGIYATRPTICRTWYCLWRRIGELPNFTRPDKIGVMLSVDQHEPPCAPFEKFYIIARPINGLDDFENPQARAAIQMFIDEGSVPVWLGFEGSKWMIYPSQEVAAAVLNPATGSSPAILAHAALWRQRLQIK